MDGYIGEVKYFAGTYPPKNWVFCDGQILPASQWGALFSIMGNQFGGDGINNFALPDLRGRMPIGSGQGSGLTYRHPGGFGGFETIQITEYTMPPHNHQVSCDVTTDGENVSANPEDKLFATSSSGARYGNDTTDNPTMKQDMVVPTGGSYPHGNMPPYTVLNHIICVQGIYPPRS